MSRLRFLGPALIVGLALCAWGHEHPTAQSKSSSPAATQLGAAPADTPASGIATPERKILYWYDPMHPAYKADKPGIAPDCGMDLVPKYADQPAVEAMAMPMAPPASARPMGGVAALLAVLTGLLLLLLYTRRKTEKPARRGFDLLRIGWLRRFVRWKYFQPALQAPNLAVFALVIYLGFFDTQVGGRNLATKLTWTIWWAAIIFAFVLVGRLWCAMCPFGALTMWASRIFKPARRLPAGLRNLWIATLAFALLTWVDESFGIVASPRRTAWLVVLIAAVAIATGALFQRASFCRSLCPIGGLIGLYSMVAPMELRAVDKDACAGCLTKDCFHGNEQGQGCPMFEFPAAMERNNYCNLCGECVKTCREGNIGLQLRPPMQDLWSNSRRRLDEAFLAILLVGLVFMVTGHMIEPWHQWMDRVGDWLPWAALGIRDHQAIESLTFTVVYVAAIFVLAPLLLLLVSWASRRLAPSNGSSLRQTFTVFAYMFVPIGLALHLAHNLLHLLKEGPGIVPVVERTINDLTPWRAGTPNWQIPALASDATIYYLQMAVVLGFYLLSLWVGWKLALRNYGDRKMALKAVLPMVIAAAGFTLLNVFLLSQPMSARHHH